MKKWLFRIGIAHSFLVCALGFFYLSISGKIDDRLAVSYSHVPPLSFSFTSDANDLLVGERIARIRNGCVDCHGDNFAGRMVIEDPAFATVHGPNITPHALGKWTDGEVARAIRHGIGKDGQPLVLMPSHEYASLSERDLFALVQFLRTLPAVDVESGLVELGVIARVLLHFGKAPSLIPAEIIDHARPFPVKPEEIASMDFGAYLVGSACVGCHGAKLEGGPIPGGDPSWIPAASLTVDALADWSFQDFKKAMREGISKTTGAPIRPPMPIALTKQMNETELKSLWLYLSKRPIAH